MAKSNSFSNLCTFVLTALVGSALAGIGPVTDLEIVNAVIAPDGFSRTAILSEGVYPGPPLIGHKGDKFQVNVINKLTNRTMVDVTSIHFHGVSHKNSNWADGATFVNQCPIVPGNSFTYEFTAANNQAGTFWYHSHHSTQYCDGLAGPMVIYDPDDPHKGLYDVDDESTIITVSDWYHTAAVLLSGIVTPDSTLVNGLGRWSGNPTSDLAVIKVTCGKRYRFRLVSASCDANLKFSIDDHTMKVIEADGQNTEPLDVDQIQIFTGQRYSFVLEANQPVGNYWIRNQPNFLQNNATGFDNGINSAILRYEGAPEEEPATIPPPTITNPLLEHNLHPLENPAAPGDPVEGGVDHAVNLAIGFDSSKGLFTINGDSYASPEVPILLQILSGAQTVQDLLPKTNIYALPINSTIEVSLPGLGIGGPHPFYFHGHTFSVVKSAGQTTPNYVNPVRRDTISTGLDGDNVTIRFKTDNPGPWFMHCHIEWHFPLGLSVVFAEDLPGTVAANPIPNDWNDLCPKWEAYLADNQ